MMPAEVTIAVVPRDRFGVVRRCIDGLYASTHVPFRLLVVTGGTDNATKTYLRELERQQRGVSVVYFDHFLAQGEAREIALRHTDDRFVVLLENDTIMHDNWLVRLLEWNDSGDVEWLGWRDDMPELIRNSHVVCLPSYYGEGVPRILIEAAASGRPIVTTNSSGCREVVRNRENGFLVPPHDIGALVDSIATLLDSPSLRLTMGKRGRKRAVDEFGLARATDANVEVYCSLLNSRDRSSKCSVLLNRDVHANPRISCPEADILRIRTHR